MTQTLEDRKEMTTGDVVQIFNYLIKFVRVDYTMFIELQTEAKTIHIDLQFDRRKALQLSGKVSSHTEYWSNFSVKVALHKVIRQHWFTFLYRKSIGCLPAHV